VANNGVGESWPQIQVDAYFAGSNALNARFGNRPDDVFTHHVWAPDRKVDPATAGAVRGPWQPRAVTGAGTWDLDDIRAECNRRATTGGFLMALTDAQQAELYERVMGALPGTYSNQVRGPGPSGPRTFTLDDQDGGYIVSLLEQILAKL
jgi:hypothetical protein